MEINIGRFQHVQSINHHLMIINIVIMIRKKMFMMMNTISLSNIIRLNVIEVVHLKTYTYYRKYITMQVMVIALA